MRWLQTEIKEMWHLVTVLEAGVKGKVPKNSKLREDALGEMPRMPSVQALIYQARSFKAYSALHVYEKIPGASSSQLDCPFCFAFCSTVASTSYTIDRRERCSLRKIQFEACSQHTRTPIFPFMTCTYCAWTQLVRLHHCSVEKKAYLSFLGICVEQSRDQKYRYSLLHWRSEAVAALEDAFLQATNLELAVFSHSADVAEEQLSILLNTLYVLVSSLSSLPAEIIRPIMRAFAAVDALPLNSLPPQARVMEATLLGFGCLAAAQFQVTAIIQV